jgi:predicted metal-dependent hydrolase
MLADEATIDYVVIHELAHLIQLNHSKVFWAVVERYSPDYKVQRKKLRELGKRLYEAETSSA